MDKDTLLEQFQKYLDETDQCLLENYRSIDLFSLFQELAALKSEVKRESRHVKAAFDNFKAVFSSLEANYTLLSQGITSFKENEVKAQQALLQPLLLDLVAFRETLTKATQGLLDYKPKHFPLFHPKEDKPLASLQSGNQLLLSNLDNLLKRYHVVAIDVLGQPFNPHLARVVDVGYDSTLPNGIVLAERQKGYYWQEKILCLAHVVVNKPGGDSNG